MKFKQDRGKLHPYNHVSVEGDITVDLIRPHDLVALTVTLRGVTQTPAGDGRPAEIVMDGGDGWMFVDFPFQHAHEQATYEVTAGTKVPDAAGSDGPEGKPRNAPPSSAPAATPPVGFRAARTTRLVFRIPDGTRFEYSTAGILGAMPWLPPVLHPRGEAPGVRPPRYQLPSGLVVPIVVPFPVVYYALAGDLVATVNETGVTIAKATATQRRNRVADPATVLGRAALARNARTLADVIAVSKVPVTLGVGVSERLVPGVIGEAIDLGRLPPIFRRATYSTRPTLDQTAIEAPFRLVMSPTSEGRWVHASQPARAGDATGHVELWHTRLDTGKRTPENLGLPPTPGEDASRVLRAVWTRDRDDLSAAVWQDKLADRTGALSPNESPFLGSLDRADRHRIVRQTSEIWPSAAGPLQPAPVGADRLWLTALGAWLDYHGQWVTKPYSKEGIASVLAWDHFATGGRDQFVRVVYPGYLYPLGQPTVLVKITERSIRPANKPIAGLYQRQFLVLIDPVRVHSSHGFPFIRTELTPRVTPNLDMPAGLGIPGLNPKEAFWPTVGGTAFAFDVAARDRDDEPARFPAALIWVAEHIGGPLLAKIDQHYRASPHRVIDLKGQPVAFAPKNAQTQKDARLETQRIRLRGTARQGGSTPSMSTADVVLPAAQALAGTGPTTITYYPDYRAGGFTVANRGRVWASTLLSGLAGDPAYKDHVSTTGGAAADPEMPLPRIGFGDSGGVGSDRAGGFIQPNLTIAGLSTEAGPVGDLQSVAGDSFDPAAFLGDAMPRLFGLFKLTDLLKAGGLDQAPKLVTDALDSATALVREIEAAKERALDAVAEAQRVLQSLQDQGASQLGQAQALVADAQALQTACEALVAALPSLLDAMKTLSVAQVEAELATGLRPKIADLVAKAKALARPPLPMFARTRLLQLADALKTLAAGTGLAADLLGFLNGARLDRKEISFRYEWRPKIQSWPSSGAKLLQLNRDDGLALAVRGTLKAQGAPSFEVLAELRDFQLNLFANDPLLKVPFRHISFKSGSTGKTEIDVMLDDVVFGGFLEFVNTLKDLIPLDGFSDPPFVDVAPSGLTAGFTLALPNVAVGVFNLSNISLGADVKVPFLGEAISVGFNFCTREKPFVLAVVMLGGGGWFLIRMSPKGLEILELGLEAGAYLAVDFGVASGSISAVIGIYIRLEGEQGSLTGYFRLRGEVDVLGLISAAIELYMELVYEFHTGKMLGRATITVEVEVLFFSGSVSISAERRFAGSNGDPSLREIVMESDGRAPAWDTYLEAFASEVAA